VTSFHSPLVVEAGSCGSTTRANTPAFPVASSVGTVVVGYPKGVSKSTKGVPTPGAASPERAIA
jgi:hypothetical protein